MKINANTYFNSKNIKSAQTSLKTSPRKTIQNHPNRTPPRAIEAAIKIGIVALLPLLSTAATALPYTWNFRGNVTASDFHYFGNSANIWQNPSAPSPFKGKDGNPIFNGDTNVFGQITIDLQRFSFVGIDQAGNRVAPFHSNGSPTTLNLLADDCQIMGPVFEIVTEGNSFEKLETNSCDNRFEYGRKITQDDKNDYAGYTQTRWTGDGGRNKNQTALHDMVLWGGSLELNSGLSSEKNRILFGLQAGIDNGKFSICGFYDDSYGGCYSGILDHFELIDSPSNPTPLDRYTLTPEPSSLATLLSGLGLLFFTKKLKNRRQS